MNGCWEAFCGTGRALPVPVSDRLYKPVDGPLIAKLSPASAGLKPVPVRTGSTTAFHQL